MRVLVDLNLILDVLLDREPHVEDSAALWAAIENDEAEGLVPAHCVTTLHSLASRSGGRAFANECVAGVLSVFGVAPVDSAVLEMAVAMQWADFEDAVCAAAGQGVGCHLLATRDLVGFKRAGMPVMTAAEALRTLRMGMRG